MGAAPVPRTPDTDSADRYRSNLSTGFMVVILILLVIGMIVSGLVARAGLNWVLVGFSMLIFMAVLGIRVRGRVAGILINERNLMSLSRFQVVLWTLIILSAYLTFALYRIRLGIEDALLITLDENLLILMGISTTSLVGGPLILSTKKGKTPASLDKVVEATAARFNQKKEEVEGHREGVLYGNPSAADADFSDMFEGEELKNTSHIDLAKVQMFYFTIIAAIGFCALVFKQILHATPENLASLPALPDGLIIILGISHAGYLGNKAVGHTETQ